MSSQILQVKNLSVKLDNEIIINNLSFSVNSGDFLTVLGPNGSGKTVLLKTLLNLIPHQSGEIKWKESVKVGYLPQGLTQIKFKSIPLSVKEFLMLKKIPLDEMSSLMKMVGIKDEKALNKQLGKLSGGQFQRILMIWALADNPNVLLFDEPTTGVDVHGEKTVYELLSKLQKTKNMTIILITHDFSVVYKYSTGVLCMSKENSCQTTPAEALTTKKLEEIYGMPVKLYQHNHH